MMPFLQELDPTLVTWDKITVAGFAVGIIVCIMRGWLVPGYAYQQIIMENINLRRELEGQRQLTVRATDTVEQVVQSTK